MRRLFLLGVILFLSLENGQCQMPKSYTEYFCGCPMIDTIILPQLNIKDSNLFRIMSEAFLHDSIYGARSDSSLYLFLYRDTISDDTLYIKSPFRDEWYTIPPNNKVYIFDVEFFPRYYERNKRRIFNNVGITLYRGHPILIFNRNKKRTTYDTMLFSNTGTNIVFPIYDLCAEEDWFTRRYYIYYNDTILSITPIHEPF